MCLKVLRKKIMCFVTFPTIDKSESPNKLDILFDRSEISDMIMIGDLIRFERPKGLQKRFRFEMMLMNLRLLEKTLWTKNGIANYEADIEIVILHLTKVEQWARKLTRYPNFAILSSDFEIKCLNILTLAETCIEILAYPTLIDEDF